MSRLSLTALELSTTDGRNRGAAKRKAIAIDSGNPGYRSFSLARYIEWILHFKMLLLALFNAAMR